MGPFGERGDIAAFPFKLLLLPLPPPPYLPCPSVHPAGCPQHGAWHPTSLSSTSSLVLARQ
jgi:hypothetical protein